MSRIEIKGLPHRGRALYLLEIHAVGCGTEKIKDVSPQIYGAPLRPCKNGSLLPVYHLYFTKDGKKISPKPVRWRRINKEEGRHVKISRINNPRQTYMLYYNKDIVEVRENIARPTIRAVMNISDDNRYKFYYLVSFDKNRTLPDSVSIVMSDKDVKAAVDKRNEKFHLVDVVYVDGRGLGGRSYYYVYHYNFIPEVKDESR